MSTRQRRALGVQAIHLIRETAETIADIDRTAANAERAVIRAKVEAASIRPTPGTSDLLATPVCGRFPGIGDSPRTVEVHDLIGMMLIHLRKK